MGSSGPSTVQAKCTFRRTVAKAGACTAVAGRAGVFLTCIALGLVTVDPAASATGASFYAYANGRAAMPSNCPETGVASKQCTLAEALSLVPAGGTVALATPGSAAHYVGNWAVSTPRTSSSSPVTIEAAPGVTDPVLDGNHGSAKGCRTTTCDGPILAVRSDVHVRIDGLTLQNADNTTSDYGGAIVNDGGGVVSVSSSTFSSNVANDGGAIDNGDDHGSGTLALSGSTFSGNSARASKSGLGDGGAIDNGDHGGMGNLTVSSSAFSGNKASGSNSGPGDGGVIDNGDHGATGALTLSGSSFSGNSATGGGGAIDNGDNGGTSTLGVSASTFSGDTADYGGAIGDGNVSGSVFGSTFSENVAGYGGGIDNGDYGLAVLKVSGSTFSQNRAAGNGGAVDNGDGLDLRGTLTVLASTFWGNSANGNNGAPAVKRVVHNGDGGAIDNGDNEGTGTLIVSGSTFSGNTAKTEGGAINNLLTVWATANIFDGSCHESVGGLWNDEGYNVATNSTCLSGGTGDVSHGAGKLAPLARNGGPTESMLPLPGNPALHLIPVDTTEMLSGHALTLCPTTDQRGTASGTGRHCNAGAVQSAGTSP
jgi:hypothetical protein